MIGIAEIVTDAIAATATKRTAPVVETIPIARMMTLAGAEMTMGTDREENNRFRLKLEGDPILPEHNFIILSV
jgi:hypothetical protein